MTDIVINLAPYIYNRNNFYFRDHPIYHPDSAPYMPYWEKEERKAVEGFWGLDQKGKTNDDEFDPALKGGWRFITPQHYWYTNYCFIQHLPDPNAPPITQMPDLRDIDWYWFYVFIILCGFSGFEFDENYSCHSLLYRYELSLSNNNITFDLTPKEKMLWNSIQKTILKPDGSYKRYIDPLVYLKSTFSKPLGRVLYENYMSNGSDLEARGGGKQVSLDTKIRTNKGWITMRDLRVGDKVYGSDGKLTNVIFKSIPEKAKYYKITLRDGRTIEACEDHQWKVWEKNRNKSRNNVVYSILKTKDLLPKYRRSKIDSRSKQLGYEYQIAIPTNKAIELSEKNLPIDPYILGALIGDGCMLNHKVSLTSQDQEMFNYFINWCNNEGYTYKIITEKDGVTRTILITDKNNKAKENRLLVKLRKLGIHGKKSEHKFIPYIYLNSSIEQRQEVLKGLMDTDGFSDQRHIEFYTTSDQLSNDYQELVRSLGMNCKHTIKKTTHQDCNRISLYTNERVFKLNRKYFDNSSKSCAGQSKWNKTFITNIEPVEDQVGACISVDNEDSTYLLQDYIVTHNTFRMVGVLSQYFNFYGARTYEQYLEVKKGPTLCVGSAESSKSGALLKKFEFSQNELVDNFGAWIGDDDSFIPGFFHKETSGVMSPGNEKNPYRHQFKAKKGKTWKKGGTFTAIVHQSYHNNPEAFVGNRALLMLEDEFGLNEDATDCAKADNTVMKMSGVKMGVALKSGTGGNVTKVQGAKEIFYNPDDYGYYKMEDFWEHSSNGIGMFIPCYYVDSSFRDENGNQNIYAAYKQEMFNRKKLIEGTSLSMLDGYIIDHPIVPSEMFLAPETNIFPVVLIREHKAMLEAKNVFNKVASFGFLEYTDKTESRVEWKVNTDRYRQPIKSYDLKSHDGNIGGCITVFQHPVDNIPDPTFKSSLYKIAVDPVADDKGGKSLYAITVYKGYTIAGWNDDFQNTIVAEYYGRTDDLDEMHEMVIKLCLYYNCKNLPETNLSEIIRYFKRRKKLHLFQAKPFDSISKVVANASGKYDIGVDMTAPKLKIQGEQLINKWLNEKRGQDENGKDVLTLHSIISLRILDELLMYDRVKNTDGVITLMLIMFWIYQEELVPVTAKDKKSHKSKVDEYFDNRVKNRYIENSLLNAYTS